MPVIEVITREQTDRYPFDGQRFLIGRGEDCHAIIGRDTKVSRHHCEVVLYRGTYILHDLKSRNGTLVVGKPIEAVKLVDTGVFQVGDAIVRFFLTEDSADLTPPGRYPKRSPHAGGDSIEDLLAATQISEPISGPTQLADDDDDEPVYDVAVLVDDDEDAPLSMDGVDDAEDAPLKLDDEDEDDHDAAAPAKAPKRRPPRFPAKPTQPGQAARPGLNTDNVGIVNMARIGKDPGFGIESLALMNARGKVVHEAGQELSDATEALSHLQLLTLGAIRCNASDIHLEPKQYDSLVRVRVDGAMIEVCRLDAEQTKRLMSLVKVLCDIDLTRKSIIQEGHFAAAVPDRSIDYRVSFAPAMYGQKMVIRVLDPALAPQQLNDLDMPAEVEEKLRSTSDQSTGMVLVCGPTGSGKTTTLYAVLRNIDASTRNVITIEDPIEYEVDGVTQIPVDTSEGHTFAALLRTCLRQDPDVIVLGEVRDQDTAVTAMQAATTGHLVLSTLHATDTVSTVLRLLDLGVEPYLIASTLNVVLAQRLVRKLCPQCKQATTPSDIERQRLRLAEDDTDTRIYKPVGCPACFETGYHGRVGVFELLSATDPIRDLILHRPNLVDLRQALAAAGFKTLQDHAIERVLTGTTSIEDAHRMVGLD